METPLLLRGGFHFYLGLQNFEIFYYSKKKQGCEPERE